MKIVIILQSIFTTVLLAIIIIIGYENKIKSDHIGYLSATAYRQAVITRTKINDGQIEDAKIGLDRLIENCDNYGSYKGILLTGEYLNGP